MKSSKRNLLSLVGVAGIIGLLFIALISSENVDLFGTAGVATLTSISEQSVGADASSSTIPSYNLSSLPDWRTVPTCGPDCSPYLLYHTDETNDWEIFRLNNSDSDTKEASRQNISFGESAVDFAPSRSPDGQWIVFSSDRDSTEGVSNWEIYLASADGDPESVRRLTYNAFAVDTGPVWGPNQYVVFESTRDGNWELYMLDMESGREYRLTDNSGDDVNPNWSPDGSKLLFESNRDGLWQLYELNLSTRTLNQVTDGSIDVFNGKYAPTNDKISYLASSADSENTILYVMDADGRNSYAVTTSDENAMSQSWSPDGDLIAYQSDLDGDQEIYIYQQSTGSILQLTHNTVDDFAPTWRCDTNRVVFASNLMGSIDLYEADYNFTDIVDNEPLRLTFYDSSEIYPQSAPSIQHEQVTVPQIGENTPFLNLDLARTEADVSQDRTDDWQPISVCPIR